MTSSIEERNPVHYEKHRLSKASKIRITVELRLTDVHIVGSLASPLYDRRAINCRLGRPIYSLDQNKGCVLINDCRFDPEPGNAPSLRRSAEKVFQNSTVAEIEIQSIFVQSHLCSFCFQTVTLFDNARRSFYVRGRCSALIGTHLNFESKSTVIESFKDIARASSER